MRHHRLAAFILMCAVAGAATTTYVKAQEPKFRQDITVQGSQLLSRAGAGHFVTFSQPFSLPGMSLGAGTYVFRAPANGVIQVFAESGGPYAQVMTVPIARTGSGSGYEARFASQGDGAPLRLVAIWMAGEQTGQEILYRK